MRLRHLLNRGGSPVNSLKTLWGLGISLVLTVAVIPYPVMALFAGSEDSHRLHDTVGALQYLPLWALPVLLFTLGRDRAGAWRLALTTSLVMAGVGVWAGDLVPSLSWMPLTTLLVLWPRDVRWNPRRPSVPALAGAALAVWVAATVAPNLVRLQRMLGHISALTHRDPKSVLIVGFGAGVTAGSFTRYSSIQNITICEMEPLIPPATTKYFGEQNYGVLNDKRTRVHYDDARHFVLTTPEKFDIITADPIHPWVRGAASLYTAEFYELCRASLTPSGVVTQWVPLYESNPAAVIPFFEVTRACNSSSDCGAERSANSEAPKNV